MRPRCDEPYDQLTTVPAQNPLPGFRTVREHTGLRNVRHNTAFFRAAGNGTLPSVAWVMPSRGRGEHPPDRIATGQKWVSRVVNAAMEGPDAGRTAVFLVWDEARRALVQHLRALGVPALTLLVADAGSVPADEELEADGVRRLARGRIAEGLARL